MHNKKLKKIMTDLAAGHITEAESEILIGDVDLVLQPINSKKGIEQRDKIREKVSRQLKNSNTQKEIIKSKEVK